MTEKYGLAVDGGGGRGYISAIILALSEKEFGFKAYERFDIVAGTSAGSIIAGCIAIGMSGNEIVNLFATKIFPAFKKQQGLLKWPRLLARKYIYSIDPFMESLIPFVGDTTLKDVKTGLLLTARDLVDDKMIYYVNQGPGANRYQDLLLRDIIKASSAAPIYFPPHMNRFIDGGVGLENNPLYRLLVEMFEYIGKSEDYIPGNVKLFSLGTGISSLKRDTAKMWILPSALHIISILMNSANISQTEQSFRHYGKMAEIIRVNPELSKEYATNQLGLTLYDEDPANLKLDSVDLDSQLLMYDIAKAEFEKRKPELEEFFTS